MARDLDFADAASYSGVEGTGAGQIDATDGVRTTWCPGRVGGDSDTTNACDPATAPATGTEIGWDPIGDNDNSFTPTFDGNGNTIANLMSARISFETGLFNYLPPGSMVRDVILMNAMVSATRVAAGTMSDPPTHVGALVGQLEGTITAVSAEGGAVSGDDGVDNVGGLVGRILSASGSIVASYATGAVSGDDGVDNVGGLVGSNFGSIVASYATGAVDGGDGNDDVGGLVGDNRDTIMASYATGAVDGGDGNDDVGGLVGFNSGGTITASYATTGAVDGGAGTDRVGGLVGAVNGGTITASYGFSTPTGGTIRTGDGGPPVAVLGGNISTANGLTTTNAGIQWTTTPIAVWNFAAGQRPVLQWVTGLSGSTYSCDVTLLPTGQSCGGIIPGQGR